LKKEGKVRNKILFFLSVVGVIGGLVSAYIYGVQKKPPPPLFSPASNPYSQGVYANGIIESYQTNGENINIYPEVSGVVTHILVTEGETVSQGVPLLQLDESVQKALVEQQSSQAEAARTALEQLKAQPRKENLEVARAQVEFAAASLKNVQDQLDKVSKSYALDPKSVSKDAMDNAANAVRVSKSNLGVAEKQYELTKAGAWIYDIRNQEHQYEALVKAYTASKALLDKFTLRAPADGVILAIKAAVGSYVSPQGTYGTYTQGFNPIIVMGGPPAQLAVRCYVDEILIPRLPKPESMTAKMFIRGTKVSIPLDFMRVQPYVTPKIELSNQRTERVDVRVLPIIFRFQKPQDLDLFPGQLVDVYLGAR
jgi:HlyD family secretion protein